MYRVAGRRPYPTGVLKYRPEDGSTYARRPAYGFSLLELLVVMIVTVLLTAMVMPALAHLKENAHRVICASNLRQTGMATVIYADDHNDNLPKSFYASGIGGKQEMMAAHLGKSGDNWEGLGWLWIESYCTTPQIFYCPSHTGDHLYQRYEEQYLHPGGGRIYTNYHYAGDYDWAKNQKRRLKDESLVIATDGLRTLEDFNHEVGVNLLRGDCSVTWRDDVSRKILEDLPDMAAAQSEEDNTDEFYSNIWNILQNGPE